MSLSRSAACAIALLVCTGCSNTMHSLTGDTLAEFAVDHMTPYLLGTGDVQMACETGVSLVSMLLAYKRVTDEPHQAAVGSLVSAASCAQMEAWEHDLGRIRALRAGNGAEATDARIREKRAHALAADRFYRSWKHMVALYGEPAEGKCPELDEPTDEVTWLLGLLSGAQAVQHDRAANGAAGVPLDLPRKADRGLQCLNNERWWHVPMALRAAVWAGVPGSAPEGEDPWKRMAEAAEAGAKTGVRVAQAVYAMSAAAAGKSDVVRAVIKAHVASKKEVPAPPEWRLLDGSATYQLRVLSDRLWTEAQGHRTPNGRLGDFWDDAAEEADASLFEGLDDEEEAAEEAPAEPESETPAEEKK